MLEPGIYDHLLRTASTVAEPLHAAIARIGPIAVPGPTHASVAERLFVEIVNQQISTKAALAIWGRIELAATARGGTVSDLFVPGFEPELRACGVSGNKIRALHSVREADEAALLGPDLAGMPHAERVARLCRIRGVGPWTADMIGIFHFLDPDIWPVGDIAAVAVLRQLTGEADTAAFAAHFAPYRSILARYAWRIRAEPGPVPS